MLNNIQLSNFQGFKGLQSVRVAPITLIFGPNASGKSSISRALRILKQSNKSSLPNGTPVSLTFKGPEIDLADFNNVKFGQGKKPELELEPLEISLGGSLSWENEKFAFLHSFDIRVSIQEYQEAPGRRITRPKFATTIRFKDPKSGNPVGLTMEFDVWSRDTKVYCEDGIGWLSLERLLDEYTETWPLPWDLIEDEEAWQEYERHGSIDSETWADLLTNKWSFATSIYGLLPTSDQPKERMTWTERRKLEFLGDVCLAIRSEMITLYQGLEHIKPFRAVPSKIDVKSSTRETGDWSIQANEWLKRLTDGRYEVVSASTSVSSKVNNFEVVENYVNDLFTGSSLGFDEVGTGISQIFPILKSLFSPPESEWVKKVEERSKLLLIEQPELHLHPRMQGDFADAVIDAVLNNQWPTQAVIETHSENLLLRLQKRIREGSLDSEAVAIVYAEASDAPVKTDRFNVMSNITLDSIGDVIDPFPTSFASLRVEDLL
jgi:hypothetical protein